MVIALMASPALGEDLPTWADETANALREDMKKNKYEEVCAFYGTLKRAGFGRPTGPSIAIGPRARWALAVTVGNTDRKSDLLPVDAGQDLAILVDFPHHVGVKKDDLGAEFYFVVWRERHNEVDYYTLTAFKREGSAFEQFALAGALSEGKPAAELGQEESATLQCVQPETAKWEQVRVGMSEADVRILLGVPLHETEVPEEFRNDPTFVKILTYGRIRFASPAMPHTFEFSLTIKQGKVSTKEDPFGGELSKNGRPTTPQPFLPLDRTVFDYFPRFADLRWRPSSGEHPLHYMVEVETGQHEVDAGKTSLVYGRKQQFRTNCPYQAISFVGKNPGRWRVMSVNKKGQSAWSEWRYFRFEQ